MDLSIKFGDAFSWEGKEYIFLARTDEIVYAALILDKAQTGWIENSLQRAQKDPRKAIRIKQMPIYCCVTLSTERFKERMANFGQTQNNDWRFDPFDNYICRLNDKDINAMKKEIIESQNALPIELIDIVNKLG